MTDAVARFPAASLERSVQKIARNMLYILHTGLVSLRWRWFLANIHYSQCRWFIARLTCSLPLGQGWQLNVVFPQVHPVDIVLLCHSFCARRFGGRGGERLSRRVR
jgi:hypothetical protein